MLNYLYHKDKAFTEFSKLIENKFQYFLNADYREKKMTVYEENKNALTLSMDINKQYKFEVYNRNSFSDEQKKEKRILIIFGIVCILVIAFLFIRGAYLERIQFEEKVEGILLDKKKGSRGSYIIKVFDIKSNNNMEYVYNNLSDYRKLEIGDSIFKNSNSHIVNVYRKKNGTYIFFHSFSISRRW